MRHPNRARARRKPLFMSPIFKGETFYLDLGGHHGMQSIEADIQSLGGKIEKFLSKDVTCLVTASCGKKAIASTTLVTSPSSPGRCGSPTEAPSRVNRNNSGINPPLLSRGQALLLKASKRQNTICSPLTDVPSRAKEWGINTVHISEIIRKIKREKKKGSFATSQIFCRQTTIGRRKKRKLIELQAPFLKFEDDTQCYRVYFQQFDAFPTVYVPGAEGSPFVEPRKQHMQRADSVPAASMDKKPTKVGATPHRGRTHASQLHGYCECCDVKYWDSKAHYKSDQHKKFVNCKENFADLDAAIAELPSLVTFTNQLLIGEDEVVTDTDAGVTSSLVVGDSHSVRGELSTNDAEDRDNHQLEHTSQCTPFLLTDDLVVDSGVNFGTCLISSEIPPGQTSSAAASYTSGQHLSNFPHDVEQVAYAGAVNDSLPDREPSEPADTDILASQTCNTEVPVQSPQKVLDKNFLNCSASFTNSVPQLVQMSASLFATSQEQEGSVNCDSAAEETVATDGDQLGYKGNVDDQKQNLAPNVSIDAAKPKKLACLIDRVSAVVISSGKILAGSKVTSLAETSVHCYQGDPVPTVKVPELQEDISSRTSLVSKEDKSTVNSIQSQISDNEDLALPQIQKVSTRGPCGNGFGNVQPCQNLQLVTRHQCVNNSLEKDTKMHPVPSINEPRSSMERQVGPNMVPNMVNHSKGICNDSYNGDVSSDDEWEGNISAVCCNILDRLGDDLQQGEPQLSKKAPKVLSTKSGNEKHLLFSNIQCSVITDHNSQRTMSVLERTDHVEKLFSSYLATVTVPHRVDILKMYAPRPNAEHFRIHVPTISKIASDFTSKCCIEPSYKVACDNVVPRAFLTCYMTQLVHNLTLPLVGQPLTVKVNVKKGDKLKKIKVKFSRQVKPSPARFNPSCLGQDGTAAAEHSCGSSPGSTTESTESRGKRSEKSGKQSCLEGIHDSTMISLSDRTDQGTMTVETRAAKTPSSKSVHDKLTNAVRPQLTNNLELKWVVQRSGDCKLIFSVDKSQKKTKHKSVFQRKQKDNLLDNK